MLDNEEYLEQDFIIFNSSLALRDFVTIDKIEKSTAYLSEPYEMVFFNLEELISNGKIFFEQCIVFTEEFWRENQTQIQRESFFKQQSFQKQFHKEINNHNKTKEYLNEQQDRELLCLPLEGTLDELQIKTAFKLLAKKVHPDVGGSHEKFINITNARDTLLDKLSAILDGEK